MHAAFLRLSGIEIPRIHRAAPILVIEILDRDRNRRSERLAAADPADDLRLVMLDLHPPTPPVSVLPPRKIAVDARPIEAHPRRHSAHDDRELRTVGFAGGDKFKSRHLALQFIPSGARDLR